jgi:hypothetical protein
LTLAPVALVAAVHAYLHGEGGRILNSSGAVTPPSVSAFGAGFLVAAALGIAVAIRRRAALPVLGFLAVIVLQALVIGVLDVRAGSRSFYIPFKMMYLAVWPAAALGAFGFVTASGWVAARVPRLGFAAALMPGVVAVLLVSGRVPLVRQPSPINASAYAAGLWARDHLDRACVDYFTSHWLTGYWLHLDVLGNPRLSDRMRAETFEFRDSVGKWLEGRGLRYGLVEHPDDIPRDLRPDLRVLHTAAAVQIVENTRGRCP